MEEKEFEQIAAEEWTQVPLHFKRRVDNVALIVEDEPSEAVRAEEKLGDHETLLGLYHGIPNSERGESYGVGATLPDTITLYRLPILEEAEQFEHEAEHAAMTAAGKTFEDYVRQAVRETLWHELGHYFGLDEDAVRHREHDHSNRFES